MAGRYPLTQNGKISGYGRMLLPDGTYIQGSFRDNLLDGEARVIKSNGDYYEGQVRANKAQGDGLLC